jgi:DNA polymerase-3 subunit gamma/tau
MAKKATAPVPVTPASPSTPAPSDYTVVARRYRPQQFTDLVGQEAVAQSLMNAIKGHRVAHAYLFTGARGVGKTSTARILAKALNCVDGPTTTPCDKCEACRAIAVGEDVDVLEIDGASNRNLDDVRELRQNVQYRPQRSRYKIYIIDEVHMLTREAFNALLKTLEEPPGHVKFIFATTDVQKVPITILSRCQRFDFSSIGTTSIKDQLQRIVAQEKAEADPEALAVLARRAGGSMRDAQSLLDQALAFSSGKLTVDRIHELLGTAHEEQVQALVIAALNHDTGKVLDLVQEVTGKGVQLNELLDQLIFQWWQLMLIKSVGANSPRVDLPDSAKATLSPLLASITLDTISAGLEILLAAKGRLRTTGQGQIVVEMALIRLCHIADLMPLSAIAQQLAQMSGGSLPAVPSRLAPAARPIAANHSGGSSTADRVSSTTTSARPVSAPPPGNTPETTAAAPSPEKSATLPLTAANIPAIWAEVLEKAGPMLKGNLEKATGRKFSPAAGIRPATITLSFPRNFEADCKSCQTRMSRIEELFRKATAQPITLRCELLADALPTAAVETVAPLKPQEQRKAALQEPLVRQAVEHLGAQLLRSDEGFGTAEAR